MVGLAHDCAELMLTIQSMYRDMHMMVVVASRTHDLTASNWHTNDLGTAVTQFQQLMRKPEWESLRNPRDVAAAAAQDSMWRPHIGK